MNFFASCSSKVISKDLIFFLSPRKCRYQKCINEGMNPLLVDYNKNSATVNHENDKDDFASTSTKEKVSTKIFSYFNNEEQIKLDFLKTYDEVYSEVLLDPRGLYRTKQIGILTRHNSLIDTIASNNALCTFAVE